MKRKQVANQARKQMWTRGDEVNVSRHIKGRMPIWVPGKVDRAVARGCFVEVDGKISFYHWNDIRVPLFSEPPAPLTAKMGDLGLKEAVDKQRAAKLERRKPLVKVIIVPDPPTGRTETRLAVVDSPRAVPVSPSSDDSTSRPGVVVLDSTKLESEPILKGRPLEMVEATSKRRRVEHSPTAIGDAFRATRLSRKLHQKEVGKILRVNYSLVSKIELGDEVPDDDTLLKFAEAFGQDLDRLLALRDGRQEPAKAAEPAPVPEPPRAPEPAPAAPPTAPSANAVSSAGFIAFLAKMSEVVPPPEDPAKRADWYAHASALYEQQKA